jgi:hypothetical protein
MPFWDVEHSSHHAVHAKLFECKLILNAYYSKERNGAETKISNYCIISSRDAGKHVKVQGINASMQSIIILRLALTVRGPSQSKYTNNYNCKGNYRPRQ